MDKLTSTLLTRDELFAKQRVEQAHYLAAIAVVATKLGCYKVTEVNIDEPTQAHVGFESSTAIATVADIANQLAAHLAGWVRTEEERLNPYPNPRMLERAMAQSMRVAELLDPTSRESLINRASSHLQMCRDESRRIVKQLKPTIDKVVTRLLEEGTLSGETIREIVACE